MNNIIILQLGCSLIKEGVVHRKWAW